MKLRERYDSLFQFYAERNSVDWERLRAQGLAESQLDCNAVSSAGAQGLMQFMRPTFAEWSANMEIVRPDPFNPEHSIWCAAAYMGWLMKRCRSMSSPLNSDDTYRRAWAAYNWGIGNFQKLMSEDPEPANWFDRLPRETRDYIERIESYLG